MSGLLDAIEAHYVDTHVRTHADGCWRWHANCAVRLLVDRIRQLEADDG